MKVYEVRIKNDLEYFSDGQINRTVYVFANDVMDATMKADEIFGTMQEELDTHGCSDSMIGLRVVAITEQAEVIGDIGEPNGGIFNSSRPWSVTEFAEKIRKSVERNKK